jgi:hypothetical protein
VRRPAKKRRDRLRRWMKGGRTYRGHSTSRCFLLEREPLTRCPSDTSSCVVQGKSYRRGVCMVPCPRPVSFHFRQLTCQSPLHPKSNVITRIKGLSNQVVSVAKPSRCSSLRETQLISFRTQQPAQHTTITAVCDTQQLKVPCKLIHKGSESSF